jgi:RHS repeat-associated protein
VEVDDGSSPAPYTTVWGNPGGEWPVAGSDEQGDPVLWVAAEGVLVGQVRAGSVWDAASGPDGSLMLHGDALLGHPGAWGDGAGAHPVGPGATERYVYAGLQALPGTPFSLARQRAYDPEVGRFTSADPIGLAGGDNRFGYANGDPLGFVDPEGLSGEAVFDRGFSAPGSLGGAGGFGSLGMVWAPDHGDAGGCSGSCTPTIPTGPKEPKTGGGGGKAPSSTGDGGEVAKQEVDPKEIVEEATAKADETVAGYYAGTRAMDRPKYGGQGGIYSTTDSMADSKPTGRLYEELATYAKAGADGASAALLEYARDSLYAPTTAFLDVVELEQKARGNTGVGVGGVRSLVDHGNRLAEAEIQARYRAADEVSPWVAGGVGIGATIFGAGVDLALPGVGGEGKVAAKAVSAGVDAAEEGLELGARYADQVIEAVQEVADEASRGGGQKIYRGMKNAGGVPEVGANARALGARPGVDIPVGPDGMVHPGTGGMSVAPSPGALPEFRRPPQFGGTGRDPVWGMSTDDLGSQLRYVPDSPTHGTVQPSMSMTFDEYQQALCATGACWTMQ